MAIQIITPPAALPITVAEAKAYNRIINDDEDDVIEGLIAAARDHIEQATGRIMVATTFQLTLDAFPSSGQLEILLPRSPVLTVDSVAYDDTNGDEQILPSGQYFLDNQSEPGWLVPQGSLTWPATINAINSVRIAFTAGYAPAGSPPNHTANVPLRAKTAVNALTAHWYDERQPVPETWRSGELPYHLTRLMNGLRVWR
jgi:uncharacterized phiE125 gp8 family phage protein